jgi:nitrate reductase gamma subunit
LDVHFFLTNDFIYNLASGLLAKVAFAVFLIGTGIRTIRFISLTRNVKQDKPQPAISIRKRFTIKSILKELPRLFAAMKHTVLAKNPVTIVVSFVFHLGLFFVPLFLLAHNIMITRFMGVSLFSFSEQTTNIMTIIFLVCAFYFLARRIFSARVRMITSVNDYLILAVTTLPFLTGLLAYYQVYDYKVMIVLHMLSGELMLVAAPFTKIFHMVFFFVSRFMIIGQHTLGKGNRVWQW